MTRPPIPLPVKRQLRQEAYFGCAKCGNPILEYHHIIPFAERAHFEPEHMVALCPTCHTHVGKLSKSIAYELKKAPHNKQHKAFQGELGTDAKITSFLIGSNTFENTPVIFSYNSIPIIGYRIIDGQLSVSANFFGQDMQPEVQIVDNDIVAKIDDFWDIQHRTNYLKFQKRQNQSFFEIDLRKQPALVSARLRLGKDVIKFSPKKIDIAGMSNLEMSNCRISNSQVGLGYSNGRITIG